MEKWIAGSRSLAGRIIREVGLYPAITTAGKGGRLAFLPSSGREQSGLQRAYLVSAELNKLGWSSIVVPKHLGVRQRERVLRVFKPDLVILQKCRHPLNRLKYLEDHDLILDVDDADFLDPALSGVMVDVARAAQGVICGSRYIRDWAAPLNDNTTVIWTGSPVTGGPWPSHAQRGRIVTWAQSDPLYNEEEFNFVENVVLRAQTLTAPFTFRLYGWRWPDDHLRLQRLRDHGVPLELLSPMPYEEFLRSLRDVSVGLSAIVGTGFSQGKSFGKILGYLDAKTPVICNDAADHRAFFNDQTGVVSNDADVWLGELLALLDDQDRRESMSDLAYQAYCRHLDIRVAAKKVSDFLIDCLACGAST